MRQSAIRIAASGLAALLSLAAVGSAAANVRHTVAQGDTLSYISSLYGVTVKVLVEVNDIADANLIFVGQVLDVAGADGGDNAPQASGSEYVVQPGDTLSGIADRFGVSVGALEGANGIADANYIVVGQRLVVPSALAPSFVDLLPAQRPSDPLVEGVIDELASAEGVDPSLVRALAWVESSWNQGAVSPAGAVGVMQVMPDTALWLESDVFGYPLNEDVSVYDNVKAGVMLLRILMDASGSEELALASYYQGQWATASGLIYDDTRAYVDSVLFVKNRFWP